MKLIKAILSCAVMLSSISFGAPSNAVTNQQFEKWLAAPVHGGVNFGPVSLSNYEAGKTDSGRPRWWRKKKGILSSALVGFFTVAAALFLTFLILQCFQKLQQHRDLTSSMRQLATNENDFCVDLGDDDDDQKAEEIIFGGDDDQKAEEIIFDQDDKEPEIFFITEGDEKKKGKRRRGKGKGRRGKKGCDDDNNGVFKKRVALFMMIMLALGGMGGGMGLQKAMTNNTEIAHAAFRDAAFRSDILNFAVTNATYKDEFVGRLVTSSDLLDDLTEDTSSALKNKVAMDRGFTRDKNFTTKFANNPTAAMNIANNIVDNKADQIVTELVRNKNFAKFANNPTVATGIVNGIVNNKADQIVNGLCEDDNFAETFANNPKAARKIADGLANKPKSTLFNTLAKDDIFPAKFVNSTEVSKKLVKELENKDTVSNLFDGLAKSENFAKNLVKSEKAADNIVKELKEEFKEQELATFAKKVKETLVGDTKLVEKLVKDGKFKDQVSLASKKEVVDANPLVSLLKEKVELLQAALRAAAQLKTEKITYNGGTSNPLNHIISELNDLGPSNLGTLKAPKPDLLPDLSLPLYSKLRTVVAKATAASTKWNNRVDEKQDIRVDDDPQSKQRVQKLTETLGKIILHAEDLRKLIKSAYKIYEVVAEREY